MATHASAAKRNRQNIIRKQRNSAVRNNMRRTLRAARKALEEKSENSKALVDVAVKTIYRASAKNIIKPRTAARTVGRLMKAANP